jgi:hypothetical protein
MQDSNSQGRQEYIIYIDWAILYKDRTNLTALKLFTKFGLIATNFSQKFPNFSLLSSTYQC